MASVNGACKIICKGTAAGRGGDGDTNNDGEDGGLCLIMNHDLTIEDVTGILGGGGGGGATDLSTFPTVFDGGGGAGIVNSLPNGNNTTGGQAQPQVMVVMVAILVKLAATH